MISCKLLIIGSGPAGYTAAIYAARASMDPIQILGTNPGGQLMITTDVENYPGYRDVVQGPWLMEEMKAQAEKMGTRMVNDQIVSVDFSKRPFTCVGENDVYQSDAVIISTGAQAKWLGLESEKKFQGHGVSGCATCDGFFFRGAHVMVVGGGNTAVEEALFLTNHATHVTLVHRRDHLRAEKILQNRVLNHPKITVIWNHAVDEILGEEAPLKITSVRLRNVETDVRSILDVEGVFIAIGHAPQTQIFKDILETDEHGYLKVVPGTTKTSIPGIFAAGDVQDSVFRQAVTAAGQGCMAALEAARYLQYSQTH